LVTGHAPAIFKHWFLQDFLKNFSDWSETPKRLLASFKEWIKLERPKARIKQRGGKNAKNLFAMLKRLAAYRLKESGLQYKEGSTRAARFLFSRKQAPAARYLIPEGSINPADHYRASPLKNLMSGLASNTCPVASFG